MAEDNSDPKHLEIVRQHIVFQHFPISKLEESPEAWTIIKYKYGRLIAQDSNTVEWIYVIKSGEARVLKYLQPSEMDIVQRRKKLQAVLRAQSPFYIKHKILNFVTERDHIQTSYSRLKYHPVTRSVMSAPPDALRSQKPNISSRKGALGSPTLKQRCDTGPPIVLSTNQLRDRTFPKTQQRPKTRASVCNENINGPESSNKLPEIRVDEVDSDDNKAGDEILVETDQSSSKLKPVQNVLPESCMKSDNVSSDGAQRAVTKDVRKTLGIKTESKAKRPSTASDMVKQRTSRVVHHGKYSLPAFVQVETLSQGDVFGLRACLEPEERGPSVSLVSGNCEVLQINKKFFIRHCDDALYGLIRLKAKPFPSEEDLIDRLDVGMQWEEYKQRIVTEFLQGRRRIH